MTVDSLDLSLSSAEVDTLLSQVCDGTGRIRLDPDTVEADMARLLLGLMEFLRQLMELQAVRRMENGTLTREEEERVGDTLMRAETSIQSLARQFGLSEADLSLDLGPLGKTI